MTSLNFNEIFQKDVKYINNKRQKVSTHYLKYPLPYPPCTIGLIRKRLASILNQCLKLKIICKSDVLLSPSLQLIFSATRGSTFKSDIAIDQILVSDSCTGMK